MFCTPCFAVFPTHFSQLDLNPANLEATVEAEWILAFPFLQKLQYSMTSSIHSVMQVLMGHFTIFQSHRLSGWFLPNITKSCLNLSTLRPKYCRFLFSGHGVGCQLWWTFLSGSLPLLYYFKLLLLCIYFWQIKYLIWSDTLPMPTLFGQHP